MWDARIGRFASDAVAGILRLGKHASLDFADALGFHLRVAP